MPKMTSPLYGQRPEIGNPSTGLPNALREVKIEQRLNEQVPLDLVFRDESGKQVQLKEYFGKKPVILALVFYQCTMMCHQILSDLTSALRGIPFNVGEHFDVLTVSFDPRETPAMAMEKKELYIRQYKREGASAGWHFLTGDAENIKRLTDAVGFHYTYDEATKQFAHASGIMILTPEGKLSRYLYGLEYAPKDVRLALVEASSNKIGTPVDQLLLYCYHYDPATGRYGPVVMNIIRLAGIMTVIAIVSLLIILRRRSNPPRRRSVEVGGTA